MRIEFLEFSLDFGSKCMAIIYSYDFLSSSSDFANKLHLITNFNNNFQNFILLNFIVSQYQLIFKCCSGFRYWISFILLFIVFILFFVDFFSNFLQLIRQNIQLKVNPYITNNYNFCFITFYHSIFSKLLNAHMASISYKARAIDKSNIYFINQKKIHQLQRVQLFIDFSFIVQM